jgi:hypothetical protein
MMAGVFELDGQANHRFANDWPQLIVNIYWLA